MHNHTCTTLQAGPCRACDALTEAWAAQHDARLDELPTGSDPYRSGSVGLVSLDAFGPEAFAQWSADPARQFETAEDAQRHAVTLATSPAAPAKGRGATAEVLASIRDALRTGSGDGRATIGTRPTADPTEDTCRACGRRHAKPSRRALGHCADNLRPAMGRQDAKMAEATIRAAYAVAMAEAAEACRPDGPTGEIGWKAAQRPDMRTTAGPVVTAVVGFAVGSDGTAERAHLPVRITRDVVRVTGKGEDRARIEWTDVLDRRPTVAAAQRALTIRAARTDGTAWTPDASTYAADRFTEATEPRGPVAKPTGRKRKRDGRIGGPAVITTGPTRGAR